MDGTSALATTPAATNSPEQPPTEAPSLPPRALIIADIQKVVAAYYCIKLADLRGPRQDRVFAFPRHVAMYLARKHTKASYPQIGRAFRGKNHSTVMTACRKIAEWLQTDTALQSVVTELERQLHLQPQP